jgi:hypothetical protein
MLTNTPGAYVAAVRRHTPGSSAHKVAAARAVLAYQAVKAQQDGDYARAGRALEGLGRLAHLGDVDTAAISRNITRNLTDAAGRLTPDARALATGQRVASIIGIVSGIVSPLMSLITAAINNPGLTRAWNWVQVVLRGDVAPTFGEEDLRLMASACAAWNGGVKTGVQAVAGTIAAAVQLATVTADPETQGNARTAITVVNSLVSWVVTALDTICTNLATVYPPASLSPVCAGAGGSPRPPMAAGAEGCCQGLVFDPSDRRCKQPAVAPEPAQAARTRFQRAWIARRNVEAKLAGVPGVSESSRANAVAMDASTAAELCAASSALLTYQTIPQMPSRSNDATFVPPPLDMSSYVTVAATLTRAPSTEPYCYIALRPTAGCAAPCSSGSQGGGAGIFAVALPAAAVLWYMMK